MAIPPYTVSYSGSPPHYSAIITPQWPSSPIDYVARHFDDLSHIQGGAVAMILGAFGAQFLDPVFFILAGLGAWYCAGWFANAEMTVQVLREEQTNAHQRL